MNEKIMVEMSKDEFELLLTMAELGYNTGGLAAMKEKAYSMRLMLGLVGAHILTKAENFKVIEEKEG